jgi:hypothetical protein
MSVVDVKERYALAKAEVQSLREKLRAKRAERLDTDGESSSSHSCHLAMFSLPIYNIEDPTIERERERERERESSIPVQPQKAERASFMF